MVNFKQLLEKATSSDLSEPDWETILEIVEEIKGKNTSPKNAVKEFRKRLLDNNSNTVYHTLLVLDSVVKNCSSDIHSEILTHEFLQIMKTVVTSSSSGEKAVDKVLEMIGEWKVAFGQQSGFKAVNEIFSELQREGYHIPETELGSAAFMKKAPDWTLGERCYMCRSEFHRFKGAFRHHCRNCGKSVCAQCSGKRLALPHYGIDQPTRVCDICFKKHDKPGALESAADSNNSDLPPEYLQSSLAQESQQPSSSSNAQDSELQMKEDDDLQLAIAMSLNEQENKQKAKKKSSSSAAVRGPSPTPPPPQSAAPSAPPPSSSTLYATIMHDPTPSSTGPAPSSYGGGGGQSEPESDPNLARYLDRGYWEQRREQQAGGGGGGVASGVGGVEGRKSPSTAASGVGPEAVVLSQGTSGSPLAETVRKTIEMFLQRMHEVSGAGGSIATDPVVLSLYQNLNALQPQLLQQIDEVQQKKAKQEAVLNKLNEAKEARVTLNRMRREHQEKVRQQEKEQALLARMQMEQKLALLRQQKQEQLDFEKSLQQQRLETLQSQRSEYEQRIQAQREKERMLLIAQEKQVLQQQFGGNGGVAHPPPPSVMAQPAPPTSVMGGAHPYMAPPPTTSSYNPTSLQLQSLSLHDPTQAGPLPSKLDHTMGLDKSVAGAPPPPPYQPSSFHQPPPPPQSLSALPTDNMAAVSAGYSTGGGSYQQQQPLSSLQPSTFTQPLHQHVGMSTINPPSSMASLQPPAQMNGQPHSLESLLSVPQMGSGGGQPSSLPAQLSSGAGAPTSESFQPYQPQQQPQPGGGFGAPPPSLGGPPPQPSLPPAPNTGMMAPPGGYQQPGIGGGAYSGQPPPPASLPPPGVTGSFQPPPSLSQQPQQFGAPPPSMQMHAPVGGGGGFIPNGAHHQGQAPPQPHPPHVGRQESQPPLISFD